MYTMQTFAKILFPSTRNLIDWKSKSRSLSVTNNTVQTPPVIYFKKIKFY
jgi:hypothetical protein